MHENKRVGFVISYLFFQNSVKFPAFCLISQLVLKLVFF